MEYLVIMTLVILVAGMAGLFILALTPMKARQAESSGREESNVQESTRGTDFEQCYAECLDAKYWISVKGEECMALCNTSRVPPFFPGAP